jgi:hypothetical protein
MGAPEAIREALAAPSADDMETLRTLWRLQAHSLLTLLESGSPLKAAERAAVTAFLRDNGINRDTLKRQDAGGLMRELTDLQIPTFDEPT